MRRIAVVILIALGTHGCSDDKESRAKTAAIGARPGVVATTNPAVKTSFVRTAGKPATNVVQLAKEHLTGGIGVILIVKSGIPCIMSVAGGSPAEAAGLKQGDMITEVDGVPTAGVPISNVLSQITGFSLGSVTLAV